MREKNKPQDHVKSCTVHLSWLLQAVTAVGDYAPKKEQCALNMVVKPEANTR